MLKMSRKGYQVQAERRRKETEKEQGKLAANMEYLRRELSDLEERRAQVAARESALHMTGEEDGGVVLEGRIRQIQKKKKECWQE